jgi:dihydropteroate synthase
VQDHAAHRFNARSRRLGQWITIDLEQLTPSEHAALIANVPTIEMCSSGRVKLAATISSLTALAHTLTHELPTLATTLRAALSPTIPQRWLHARGALSLVRPCLLGVVNVTPDSFSDGGCFNDSTQAVDHALLLASHGADIIDIGGESTRPGALAVSSTEEIKRVLPVVETLVRLGAPPISVDTRKAEVARVVLDAGAAIINDISALGDPAMARVVASHRAGLVLMHMQGEPGTMQIAPRYDDVVAEVAAALRHAAAQALAAGCEHETIVLDPGIGFGKTLAHNLTLLRDLPELCSLGHALLVGTSRKTLVRDALEHIEPGYPRAPQAAPSARRWGTAATVTAAVMAGAQLVRVHDVLEMRQVADMAWALRRGAEMHG